MTQSRTLLDLVKVLLLIGFVLSLGCAREEQEVFSEGAPPVLVVPVELRDVTDHVEATGQLIAKFEATIAAQVNGQVTATRVEEGDEVVAGQILLEIDPELRILELANAEASMAEARAQAVESWRDLQRIQSLKRRDATSQALLDDANTALELSGSRQNAAEARLGLAKRALADATVRAPFAGLVARRHVSAGEYLSVGVALFELVALDPIEAEFFLAELDSSRVHLGQRVEIELAPFPDTRFEAEVTMISPTIDPMTRTLRVKALLANPDGRLKPGLFAHVNLGLEFREGVVMVPEEALLQRVDGTALYRLVDGERVERMIVRLGETRDGWVEIKGGLEPGDWVVARGQEELVDGGFVSLRSTEGDRIRAPEVASPGPASSAGSGL